MLDSAGRIAAMTARYCYLLRSSWLRVLELAYWPTMQMLVWGFLYTFLYDSGSKLASTAGLLLGGVHVVGRDVPGPARLHIHIP